MNASTVQLKLVGGGLHRGREEMRGLTGSGCAGVGEPDAVLPGHRPREREHDKGAHLIW